jgi:alcohol dehydrogenase
MRSLRFVAPRRLEWHDVPNVSILGDGEAVVEPVAASICDIDRPVIAGKAPFPGSFAIGHEGVARVVDVGDGVRAVEPGQFVAVAWHIACGACPTCRSGRTAHCERSPSQAMYGLPAGGEWGGLFDDRLRVPYADAMLTPLPTGIGPVAAVSAGDNLSLGYEIMVRHVPRGRRRVLVLGWQAVGLYQVAFAMALGADEVVYVDDDAAHRLIAEGYGARSVPGPPTRDLGRFDLVVDASFRAPWLRRGLRMLVPEGVLECLGGYFGDVELPVFAMYSTGVTLRLGRANTGPHVAPTLDAIVGGAVDPTRLHDRVLDWDAAPLALVEPGLKPVFVKPVPEGDLR